MCIKTRCNFTHNLNEILLFVTAEVEHEVIMLSEVSQTQLKFPMNVLT